MSNIKFLSGEKSNIPTKIGDGTIDKNGIIFTSDTDELVFVNEKKEQKIIKSKTQKDYVLNGTSLGALNDKATIPAGTSIDELLTMITQKAIPATYTAPTVTLSRTGGQNAGAYEAGTSITVNLRSQFTKNDGGDITAHKFYKGASVIYTVEPVTADASHNVASFVLGDETVSFKSEASFGDGPIKNNNLGQQSPNGQIKAGSKQSSPLNFTGQRNLFFGTGVGDLPELNSNNIRALSGKKLNPTQGYSWNIPIAIGQQYVIFAYPATLRDVNQVMYVETNDTGMASSFQKITADIADARGGTNGLKSYKIYSYRMAAPAAAPMTFKVTI